MNYCPKCKSKNNKTSRRKSRKFLKPSFKQRFIETEKARTMKYVGKLGLKNSALQKIK